MSEPTPPAPRVIDFYPQPVEVYLVPPRPRQRYWLHLLLLIMTVFTTLMVGTQLQMNFEAGKPLFTFGPDLLPLFPIKAVLHQPWLLLKGISFSLALMTILLAHEMGHYVFCLRYGVYATLPYFIPAPTLIGTMGAFIRIKSPIRTRQALFDIGIAGPIAGFVVAMFVLVLSLTLSKPMGPAVVKGDVSIGYPLVFRFVHWFLLGDGTRVLPLENLLLHPTAIAAWVGMFATALNLLPGGQLDGGHIVYSLAPRLHKQVSRLTVGVLIPMGVWLWAGWLVWAVLLTLSGIRHPNVPPRPEISTGRRLLVLAAIFMLAMTVTPDPLPGNSLLDVFQK
jgi:membrane-associated protease RseP (regulator of RpoE activity)